MADKDFPLIGGLPDAPAFAWTDWDHNPHIALRSGHPGNKVWSYNDRQYSAEHLLEIMNGAKAHPLDFRSNPQTAPSEYRY